jgi:hypothetical protein
MKIKKKLIHSTFGEVLWLGVGREVESRFVIHVNKVEARKVTSPMTTTIWIPPCSKCGIKLQTFFSDKT